MKRYTIYWLLSLLLVLLTAACAGDPGAGAPGNIPVGEVPQDDQTTGEEIEQILRLYGKSVKPHYLLLAWTMGYNYVLVCIFLNQYKHHPGDVKPMEPIEFNSNLWSGRSCPTYYGSGNAG